MKVRRLAVSAAIITIGLFLTDYIWAEAYIDPSVVSYAFQAISGVIIGLSAFVTIYWRGIRRFFVEILHLDNVKYSRQESNDIYFIDPESKERILPEIVNTSKETPVVPAGTVNEKTNWKKQLANLKAGIILVAAFSFLLTIYAPLELYINNINDYWFDIWNIIPYLLILFISCLTIGVLLLFVSFLIYYRLYQVCFAGAFIAYTCTYIQGTYLIKNLPPIDGTYYDWKDMPGELMQSIVLWLCVSLLIVLLIRFLTLKRVYRLSVIVSCAITVLLFANIIRIGIGNEGFRKKYQYIVTNENEFQYSENTNLIIIVIDMTDARIFSELLEEEPSYKDVFEDFTYFPEMMSAYPYTDTSLPFMLSGVWFEDGARVSTLMGNAVDQSPSLKWLEENGFRIGLYEPYFSYSKPGLDRFENVKEISNTDYSISPLSLYYYMQMKLVLYKYAPYGLKTVLDVNTVDFNRVKHNNADMGAQLATFDNGEFYQQLSQNHIEVTEDKCMRFIHINGSHMPYIYDRHLNKIDEKQGSYEEMMRGTIKVLDEYLTTLKENNIYNNSGIIILADHGYGYGVKEGRQNAVFMAKGIEEQHGFEVNKAPVSHEDLQQAYIRLAQGESSNEIFDWKEGDRRERRYRLHAVSGDVKEVEELVQTGSVNDESTLKYTGKKITLYYR